ncbi:hypothetical protein MMC22_011749, partial [Lobaria immixta]|nr:hypothetical protein [Lobaria immixta]
VATLDQVPELVRRKYLVPPGPGSPGYGIGVSAGSVDPIPPGSGGPPIQRIKPLNPVTGNPQPVSPPAVVNPPPVNPQPVNPQPATPATPPVNSNVLPIPPPPPSNLSATQKIRRLDCLRWWHSEAEFNAKPPYCDFHNPGGVLGN